MITPPSTTEKLLVTGILLFLIVFVYSATRDKSERDCISSATYRFTNAVDVGTDPDWLEKAIQSCRKLKVKNG